MVKQPVDYTVRAQTGALPDSSQTHPLRRQNLTHAHCKGKTLAQLSKEFKVIERTMKVSVGGVRRARVARKRRGGKPLPPKANARAPPGRHDQAPDH